MKSYLESLPPENDESNLKPVFLGIVFRKQPQTSFYHSPNFLISILVYLDYRTEHTGYGQRSPIRHTLPSIIIY